MPSAAPSRRYWLFKSEPSAFSFDDLWRAPKRRTFWSGVRSYQARNLLRDQIGLGDGVLFYHSNADPTAIVGVAKVVKGGYPDHTAFEKGHRYFDPDSDPAEPTWFMVDIEAVAPLVRPVTRDDLRGVETLAGMMVLRRGARLSVQPVTAEEWRAILELGGVPHLA